MNATQSKKTLERIARQHGAVLEEDSGYRDMRVFQICAPKGKRWVHGNVHIRVEICSRRTAQSFAYNVSELQNAMENAKGGLRIESEVEKYESAGD